MKFNFVQLLGWTTILFLSACSNDASVQNSTDAENDAKVDIETF